MKIACQSCGAKYTIADEKVSGKTVKIKCKKCGATVVVDGHSHDAAHAGAGGMPDDGSAAASGAEWTVSVAEDDQRTLTTAQVAEAYQQGIVNADTFVWRDGMPEWLSLSAVPELVAACGSAPAATDAFDGGATHVVAPGGAAGYAAGYGAGGYGAAPAAAATPAATAARSKARAQVDLFGAGGGAGHGGEAAPAAAGSSAHIGERNENSVLFSLSALTAAETAAKKSSAPKPARASFDMGSGGGAKSAIDDIMNLGSGSLASGGSLAPPPINAPYVEPPPPPPPPSMHPQSMHPGGGMHPASMGGPAMAQGMHGMPMPYEQQQPKKAPVGIIVGAVLAVVLLAGGMFMLGRGGDDDDVKKDAVAAADTKDEPRAEEPSKKDEPAAAKADDAAAPADTGSPAPDDAKADAKADDGKGETAAVAPTTRAPSGTTAAPPATTKKEEPKKEEPKKEDPKKEEPAASATGQFDRGAAQAALGGAAGGAKGCKKEGGPTGSTKVQVTFAPSGRVTTVNVGAPFAGTPVGSCIAGAFKGLSIPAFAGSPVTVSKTVSIR